jgi:hypothetical protein
MNTIDVQDLSEEDTDLVATLVEFLRQRKRQRGQPEQSLRGGKGPEKGEKRVSQGSPFAVWSLGVKGPLSREEIYDYL